MLIHGDGLKLTEKILADLSAQNKIIKSTLNGETSFAIIGDYKHLDKTLIVTLFQAHLIHYLRFYLIYKIMHLKKIMNEFKF